MTTRGLRASLGAALTRHRRGVSALVVLLVLAGAVGVFLQQSEISDLTSKNHKLAADKSQAIRQRNSTQQALDSAQRELAGARVFEANCAVCHFRDGGGGIGPQLFHGAVASFISEDAEIAKVTGGGPIMPAFGLVLTPEEIREVVAYTRTH